MLQKLKIWMGRKRGISNRCILRGAIFTMSKRITKSKQLTLNQARQKFILKRFSDILVTAIAPKFWTQ